MGGSGKGGTRSARTRVTIAGNPSTGRASAELRTMNTRCQPCYRKLRTRRELERFSGQTQASPNAHPLLHRLRGMLRYWHKGNCETLRKVSPRDSEAP